MQVKVSVLMPVYNQARFLKESIASVLEQSLKDFELLIMDDASKDNSLKIIKQFKDKRIKLLRSSRRQGLTKCLNRLIEKSKGKYLARMDGDDICFQGRLKKQVKFLEENQKAVLVGCWAKMIDEQGSIIGQLKYPTSPQKIKQKVLSYNPFIHSSLMMKANIIKKIGGYNEALFYSQDYDLILRLAAKYSCYNLGQFLLKFRWLPDFKKQKKQHLLALGIRFKAIKEYGYSKVEIIKLLKPLILCLIPVKLKQIYWQRRLV